MHKKGQFDVAVFGVPAFFLILLTLVSFSIYLAIVITSAPIIDVVELEDDTIELINYLKTPINSQETFADLIRKSVETNDFLELNDKTNELFKDTNFRYQLSIYEQNNILLKKIGDQGVKPNTELVLPTKDKAIIVKFYLK